MGQYEKGPGATIVNMSARNAAPVKELQLLLVTGLNVENCNTDGMPEQEVLSLLSRVSSAVKMGIDSSVLNMFVGTFTYQCERLDHYYIKDSSGVRRRLEKLYTDSFPGSKPVINIKMDKIWQDYLDFLYPNGLSLEFMINEKILKKLTEAGDQPDKERPVDHWIYFTSDADEQCFIPYALKQRFKIISKEKTDDIKRPFKLQISRADKVDLATISAITIDLKRVAMRCNGIYDKWETVLTK
jgi:hypothetical protein